MRGEEERKIQGRIGGWVKRRRAEMRMGRGNPTLSRFPLLSIVAPSTVSFPVGLGGCVNVKGVIKCLLVYCVVFVLVMCASSTDIELDLQLLIFSVVDRV